MPRRHFTELTPEFLDQVCQAHSTSMVTSMESLASELTHMRTLRMSSEAVTAMMANLVAHAATMAPTELIKFALVAGIRQGWHARGDIDLIEDCFAGIDESELEDMQYGIGSYQENRHD